MKQKEREEAAKVIGAAQQPADAAADEKATTFEPDEDLAQAEAATAAAQQQVRILHSCWPLLMPAATDQSCCQISPTVSLSWCYVVASSDIGSLPQHQVSTHNDLPDCIVLLVP